MNGSLTLILPAYNEAAGIAEAVAEADDALAKFAGDYEILVVDDGSHDDTAAIVEQLSVPRPRVRVLRHPVNQGYGVALRTGFESARGDRIAFTDADGQFDLADLERLVALTDDAPVAVGFRAYRQDSPLRRFYSWGYNQLVRRLLGTGVRDCDCALKVYRRQALAQLLPESTHFFVNTEMLTRARQRHLPIAEMPVTHRPRRHGSSKVSILDIPRTLSVLLPFWWTRKLFRAPSPPVATGGLPGVFFLLLIAIFLCFCRLGSPLLEPEEARYAEIPRQMLEANRWLVPTLHGQDYLDKPPLFYWLLMGSYSIFGPHDWAARLAAGFVALLMVAVTYWWGRRTLGPRAGFCAALVLLLLPEFVYRGRMLTPNGLLALFTTAALAAGHVARIPPTLTLPHQGGGNQKGIAQFRSWGVSRWFFALIHFGRRKRNSGFHFYTADAIRHSGSLPPGGGGLGWGGGLRLGWWLVAGIATGLGVMTKGPVALALILPPLAIAGWLDTRLARVGWRWFAFFAAMFIVAAPWFVAVSLRCPEFLGYFFWFHNVVRFAQPFDHAKPFWTYLPQLALGLLPWSLLLVPMIAWLRRPFARRPAALGLALIAFLWGLLFFSLAGSKRPVYLVPLLPPLALALGCTLNRLLPRVTLTWHWIVERQSVIAWRLTAVSLVSVMALGCAAMATGVSKSERTIAPIVAAGFALAWLLRRERRTNWLAAGATTFGLVALAAHDLGPGYARRFSLKRAAQAETADLAVYCYPQPFDAVSFYRQEAIKSFGRNERSNLMAELQSAGASLLFVKNSHLPDVLASLPPTLEFLPTLDEAGVTIGRVVPRRTAPTAGYARAR